MRNNNTMRYHRRGLNEPDVWVWNPLPDTTIDELREEIGLSNRYEQSGRRYFEINWQFSHGPEREHVVLKPGESRLLKESIAVDLIREMQEQGLISLSPDADDAQWEAARVRGIRAAQRFWHERGRPRIQAFALKNSFSDEQINQHKAEIAQWFINEAAAKALHKALDAPAKKKSATSEKASAPDAA